MDAYTNLKLCIFIDEKLKEAALEAKSSDIRYDFDVVAEEMRRKLIEKRE